MGLLLTLGVRNRFVIFYKISNSSTDKILQAANGQTTVSSALQLDIHTNSQAIVEVGLVRYQHPAILQEIIWTLFLIQSGQLPAVYRGCGLFLSNSTISWMISCTSSLHIKSVWHISSRLRAKQQSFTVCSCYSCTRSDAAAWIVECTHQYLLIGFSPELLPHCVPLYFQSAIPQSHSSLRLRHLRPVTVLGDCSLNNGLEFGKETK